ncbi:MAG TPA: hypothetical protein VM712_15675 [Gaiellales bacterium]|nr:hypothetical protein [Gaiellales bacterium]
MLLAAGVGLCAPVSVDAPSASDAAILASIHDGAKQAAAGIGLPLLGLGVALLLWFAVGLRQVLDRISGGDWLANAIVPAAALLGGLTIAGVAISVSSAVAALSNEFTADADTARVFGAAGLVVGLTGLAGGAAMVAVTTRIAQQAHALPTWAIWVSYAVALLCLTSFWSAGVASVAFALWLIGAVVAVLRAAAATLGADGELGAPGEQT